MYANLLLPVALDQGPGEQRAIAAAKALAASGATVHFLHVLEDIPAYVAAEIPKDVREARTREVEAGLQKDHDALGSGLQSQGHVVHGDPGRSILNFAEENGVDCIVMASHRPEMVDFLIGSTAAKVVRHATCSVHVLR